MTSKIIPSTGGVMQPKMTNNFVVAFQVLLRNAQQLTTEEELVNGLYVMSKQVVNVKLPAIDLINSIGGFGNNEAGMFRVGHIGQVEIEVQDDLHSIVLKTLLSLRASAQTSVFVMKTDGNDRVLDVYELRNVKVHSIEQSELRYDGGVGNRKISGLITHENKSEEETRSIVNMSVGSSGFGDGVVAFRIKGDVGAMLMTPFSGLTIQEFTELIETM